ncbi:hypothetical protein [Caudoviricetes sp.]|nr:hypothetical protein [Caudoviricetes sp.]UOF81862.1 hypothetical protein [Caudoviricetes sp.]
MSDAIIPAVKKQLMQALASVADQLSNLPADQVPAAVQLMAGGKALFEEAYTRFRDRAISQLKESGTPIGEKGSLTQQLGRWTMTAIRTRSGFDPKKVEALLRRKGLDPAAWMRTTLSYAVDEDKLNNLRHRPDVTPADLEGCKYDESFRIEVKESN